MTSCTGTVVWGYLGFERKQLVEFLPPNERVEIQTWARPDDFVRYGRRALVGLRADDVKAVSRERFCLSLSSCGKTFKLKKVNKSFVPEPISWMSCISDSRCLFHTSVYYGYVTLWRYWKEKNINFIFIIYMIFIIYILYIFPSYSCTNKQANTPTPTHTCTHRCISEFMCEHVSCICKGC